MMTRCFAYGFHRAIIRLHIKIYEMWFINGVWALLNLVEMIRVFDQCTKRRHMCVYTYKKLRWRSWWSYNSASNSSVTSRSRCRNFLFLFFVCFSFCVVLLALVQSNIWCSVVSFILICLRSQSSVCQLQWVFLISFYIYFFFFTNRCRDSYFWSVVPDVLCRWHKLAPRLGFCFVYFILFKSAWSYLKKSHWARFCESVAQIETELM